MRREGYSPTLTMFHLASTLVSGAGVETAARGRTEVSSWLTGHLDLHRNDEALERGANKWRVLGLKISVS